MMEGFIKDELKKNNVKDNRSGTLDKITFKYFSGQKNLRLSTSLNGSYGYMCVSLSDAIDFSISLNGIVIFRAGEQNTAIIPIRFLVGDVLSFEGVCSNLKVLLSGAEFESFEKDFIMYPSNKLVTDCGGVKRIYLVTDLQNDSSLYTLDDEIGCLEIIGFRYNNSNHFARLICDDDNVYICTSVDNYTNKILINFDYEDLILVCGINENPLGLLYTFGSNLCVRWVSDNFDIGSENIIESISGGIKGLKNVRVDDNSLVFAVVLYNGNTIIYSYMTKFIKILSSKSRKGQFCIVDKNFYNYYLDGYGVCIKKYAMDSTTKQLTLVSIKKIDMADSAIIGNNGVKVECSLIERYVDFANL